MSDHADGYARTQADLASARVRFRRALSLMLMTLVVPGSAQIVAGNRRIGRIAVRVWATLWVVVALVVLLGLLDRGIVISILTTPWMLWLLRFGLIALALGWVALFADAWRLGAPLRLDRGHRLALSGVTGMLCFVTAGLLFVASNLMAVQKDFITTVFGSSVVHEADGGRYNVLLLGGDSGKGRDGLRPDSITLASIDADTGDTVLVGLPRNLADVPFPKDFPMHEEFPDGFDCDGCYLNSVNTWADDHPDLFGGKGHEGVAATQAAVEEITGLPVSYHVMINMKGFASLVDAVGGVKVRVRQKTAIGGIGAPITGWIPKGRQVLDGKEALWYSRSRVQNSDYSRMARQKCVMSAMLQQLDPNTVLLKATGIAESSKKMLSTDIPAGELDTFVELALKARGAKISTVSLVPPAINTGDPDFDKIRTMVEKAVERSESGPKAPATTKTAKAPKKGAQAGSDPDKRRSAKVNDSEDLAAAC
ncbi:LytR family transcriptional regulator [Mumia zhuanghuii]|uniref:LCP family protein n=2 Tax=Mumia TaxID=1546255 RepID=A0ABW1QV40_9ACTN|nr:MULTISPECIES: LCP family protein [Mumia]KAA1422444.1 LytR family transcriptional regulator [Mumia zhuanghuii]